MFWNFISNFNLYLHLNYAYILISQWIVLKDSWANLAILLDNKKYIAIIFQGKRFKESIL